MHSDQLSDFEKLLNPEPPFSKAIKDRVACTVTQPCFEDAFMSGLSSGQMSILWIFSEKRCVQVFIQICGSEPLLLRVITDRPAELLNRLKALTAGICL